MFQSGERQNLPIVRSLTAGQVTFSLIALKLPTYIAIPLQSVSFRVRPQSGCQPSAWQLTGLTGAHSGSYTPKVAACVGLTLSLLVHRSHLRGKPWRGRSRLLGHEQAPGNVHCLMKEKHIVIFPVRKAGVKTVGTLHAQRLGTVSRARAKMAARQASGAHSGPPW